MDFDAVVVTECGERHHFSYIGHLSGSGLRQYGIFTNALSRILVCDDITNSVQILDKDWHFLSHIQTETQEIGRVWAPCYGVGTHRLWVESENNKMFICMYTDRINAVKGKSDIQRKVTDKNSSCQ